MKIAKPLLAAGAASLLLAGCATGPYYSDPYGYGYAPGYAYDGYGYGPGVALGYTYYEREGGRYYRDRDGREWRDNRNEREWRRDRDRAEEDRRVQSQPYYQPGRTPGPDYTPRNHAGEPIAPGQRGAPGSESP
jgi:hypothetical protein